MENQTPFPIKYWAEDDKPREKLLLKGKSSLSDAELLAIILGSGTRNESAVGLSKRILKTTDNSLHSLSKLSFQQLCSFNGIGPAKAISIIAALELAKRKKEELVVELPKIITTKTVFELMHPLIGDLPHEEFWVIYLNNSNQVVHKAQISKGGITGTVVDVRIILKIALEFHALSFILCHNHPSGKLYPSDADLEITNKIKIAAKQLDILLVDHMIVCELGYYSFAEDGKL
ncbi:MAG: DNA repair protein RadC [Flavobacteriales bacterium]|nr:DNA repair protein RadC [Flavobacteriales bacterium]